MLRPSEAMALCAEDCVLPDIGWGRLELHQTKPVVGKHWTDSGGSHEGRGLKNRPSRAIRIVPIPAELVAILRAHLTRHGHAPDGRLFCSEGGRVLYPSSYRYVWQRARCLALTPAQAASPLARRPYDLRHAGVSLRLNAGVPPPRWPNGPGTAWRSCSRSTPSASTAAIRSGSTGSTARSETANHENPGPHLVRNRPRTQASGGN
jgi:integrase